ncbi:galactose-specific lectin nattectin-like [Labrus mixtus]|uniref:galactose-specific lectin nattectin-like n=1 Tax=Labrus mixtus TaxID=508554 RepID=UPI0029C08766|nr:galactose-specific lectin nattectin-like [Labrus mixtus]
MGFTLQLIVLLGLSGGLLMGADAKCTKKGGCCEACPDGWAKHGERCYIFFNDKKTWCDAEFHCVEQGGNLFSLHTPEEAELVRNVVLSATGARTKTWLGSHDKIQNGCWLNSDGSKFEFDAWGPGEPNNYGGSEGCMQMHNTEGQPINDAPCSIKSAYMCARSLEVKAD